MIPETVIDSLRPDWRLFRPHLGREWQAYSRAQLRRDVVAGLTVTLVSLPQVLGFALVLGLPPATVLTCAIVGAFVAALFFSSRLVIFGATNSVTLLVASAIHQQGAAELGPLELAVVLAGLIGVLQVGAALLRLGVVTQFVSRSVIIAYSSATGVLLALTQVHNLFGLPRDRADALLVQLWEGAQRVASFEFDPSTPLTGLAALVLFLLFRAARPRGPFILAGLVVVTLAFWFVPALRDLGVPMLGQQGAVDALLPNFTGVPPTAADLPLLGTLVSTACAIAILGMLESVSLARNLAQHHGEAIDANREVMALGLGNLANALFSSVPGSASFVRSAVNAQAGAGTQVAGVAAAGLLLGALLVLSPFLNHIPVPALAASLVLIGARMIDMEQIRIAARSTGSDAAVLAVTFVAALLLPLDNALYTGVGLSLALALRKASRPTLVEYSFDAEQLTHLGDPAKRVHPQVAIIHVEGELFFGASDLFSEDIRRRVEQDDLRVVIVRLKGARHLDATTVFALRGLRDYLARTGRHLLVSGVHGDALRVFRRSGLLEHLGADNVFPAEANPNQATRKALQRAQALLGSADAEVRIYHPEPTPGGPTSGQAA